MPIVGANDFSAVAAVGSREQRSLAPADDRGQNWRATAVSTHERSQSHMTSMDDDNPFPNDTEVLVRFRAAGSRPTGRPGRTYST